MTTQSLASAISTAAEWLQTHLKAVSVDNSYAVIRADYRTRIAQAMTEYLASDAAVTGYKSTMRQAAVESLQAAFWRGYQEAAGQADYTDEDAQGYINPRVESELGFIGELFGSLKELRTQFWNGDADANDLRQEVERRVNGYESTLDAVYAAGKMFGKKNQMLTWHLGHTEEHCQDKDESYGCLQLDGKRHRAKWFIARDLFPRKPGASMTCGGYQCQCYLTDDDGKQVTM